jgi:hypothetical protein
MKATAYPNLSFRRRRRAEPSATPHSCAD